MEDLGKSRADEAFSSVTREDVQQALNDLDRGVKHPFGPSTTYDLLYESRRYPPKAVIARAAKNRTGIELIPDDFPGGEGTVAFDTLRSLGFEIVPKEISMKGAVKFDHLDCEVFERYPNTVAWAQVSQPDQERFKSIRSRLKQIAVHGSQHKGTVPLQPGTSLATPNGRSPKDIWSCVYPAAARNKSYAFQVALILTRRGAELCFCLGAGTSQIQDADEKQKLLQGFREAKTKLRSIPKATVSAVEQQLTDSWFYRQSWKRDEPNRSEFNSLSDWLEYATKDEVTSASVSTYMTPDELGTVGNDIEQKFFAAVDIFRPFLEFPFAKSGCWIFQGNPARFDIDTYLRTRSEISWSVNQYEKEVHTGDRVLMWRSGANGGVVAECQITDGPSAAIPDDAVELRNPNAPPRKSDPVRCKLRVINAFSDNVIPRKLILSNLPELPIFKFAQNTNFPISADDYESILRLKDRDSMIQPKKSKAALPALNIILYGPPGTGKTYRLRNHYMQMFTDRETVLSAEERASALVKDLSWWEVIALSLLDAKDNKASVAAILEHPLVRARLKLSANRNPRAMLWSSLQKHTKADCPTVKYAIRIEPLLFSKDNNSIWSVDAPLAEIEVPMLAEKLKDFRNPPPQLEREVRRYEFTTFHQSFSYEDFIEGIKPQIEATEGDQLAYTIQDGVFKKIALEAAANPERDYALFIDEINRGNVASIFGELITLIEKDKRLNAANELKAILPYSREQFGVPKNLYIIGTMNTADRSVEALDVALRRRFTFIEMRPERELIPQPTTLKVDLRKLFDVINARIEQLLDHDHCIGHAYFMEVNDLSDLQRVFANKIVPLLREYFYGQPAKVGMVLGDRFVSRKADRIDFAPGWGVDELDEKEVLRFADISRLSDEDFESIYASVGAGI